MYQVEKYRWVFNAGLTTNGTHRDGEHERLGMTRDEADNLVMQLQQKNIEADIRTHDDAPGHAPFIVQVRNYSDTPEDLTDHYHAAFFRAFPRAEVRAHDGEIYRPPSVWLQQGRRTI